MFMYDKPKLEKLRADLMMQKTEVESQLNQIIGAVQILNQMISETEKDTEIEKEQNAT